MNGLTHIQETFTGARASGRAALMPYFTLGYPTPAASLEIIEAVAQSGADLIELGIPFSDPLADGPTIQRSTQVALEQGMNNSLALDSVAELRRRGVRQPLMLMGYYNPLLAYGVERYCARAAQVGADGLIIPDLPPDEAAELEAACQTHGLALTFLLAPTSTPERTALVARHTSGFLYLVSLTGVTGARDRVAEDLQAFIQRARQAMDLPVAVGFGISTPEQARRVGQMADGVIVGSALINAAANASLPAQAAAAFTARLRQALEPQPQPKAAIEPGSDNPLHGFLGF
jgi:tryptophan synthase alpha chain